MSATQDSVFFAYKRGERYLWLTARPVATFEGPGARCEITSRLGRGEQIWWDFACAEARTAGGDRVLVGERRAFLTRGRTLVEARYGGGATEAEALALLDSLAPVDAETLDFER